MAHHGGSAAAVHNATALFTQQAVHDAHQQYAPGKRVFILSRSGFAGSQRYGTALWSGDVDMTFAALRKQVAIALNVGLAGLPLWGSDIGGFGFEGKCTAELYVDGSNSAHFAHYYGLTAISENCASLGNSVAMSRRFAGSICG
jgi:alpha-glucosidase (family GH31 glycosyl hydrolase)